MAMELLKRLASGIRFNKTEAAVHWRTPATLDRGTLGEACLALDGRGHGSALWENDGGLWLMPTGLRSSLALIRLPLGEGKGPRIVLNPDGRGIALWLVESGGEQQILGKILGGGESIGHILFRTEGRIQHLQGAVDRRGNALVVWVHEKTGQFEVMAHAFDTRGLAWEKEPTTLSIPSDQGVEPRIAVNHREHAMVIWEVQDRQFEGLVASHYWPADRIWSDRPVPVVSHATLHHQVAMDDMGNALAVWIRTPNGQRSSIEASSYDVKSGEWGEPEVLGSAQTFTSPQLVMAGNGEALAAWCQGEGHGNARLFAKAFVKGKWAEEVEQLDPGHGRVTEFAIAIGAAGRAGLLVLQRGPGGDWATARLRQETWSEPMPLGVASPAVQSAPRLALCPQGAMALWIQGEGQQKHLMVTGTA